MELGLVRKIDIDHEMQQSYLDYAMSVIVARALPDARDGLKPVQRRILYAMYDMGMRLNSDYKKSARIVGEVLGKYHPHGDSAVYEAMARMAQDFSMRSLLVDGQGNFGSIDGDPPAAMRYTEARLAPPALDMLVDISKNTVDFIPNFDDTLQEPTVLPSSVPNLLVNGATGIAVGMATSIPPHNLGEVVDALVYMLQHWEKMDDITIDQLMNFIQGPDFPTGGIIVEEKGQENIEAAYGSGRGKVSIQARVHTEEMDRGKPGLIVTELPYMTNKSTLIERIADLVRDGQLEGITDLRDESDRHGMRIVIELTKNVDVDAVIADLFRRTPMRSTFSIIMLALVDGEPRTLNIKQSLKVFLEHRQEIIRRRSEFELEKARQRAHILEGYLVALNNLDEIIQLIKKSADVETARERLIKRYNLTTIQADAILEMQLRRLAALERKKIETEYKEIIAAIKELEKLLHSPRQIRQVVSEELLKVKESYGDKRRTQIINLQANKSGKVSLTSDLLLPEQDVWVGVTNEGMIAQITDEKPPRPSGWEAAKMLVKAKTSDTVYLVAENGITAAVAAHTIPQADKLPDGELFHRVTPLKETDRLKTMFTLPSQRDVLPEDTYIVTVSKSGMVKKSPVDFLPGPSSQSFVLSRVNDGDSIVWAGLTDGKKELLLASSKGMAIRFSEENIRPMGLAAAGVNGMKLAVGDTIIGAEVLPQKGEIFLIATDGTAKRIEESDFPQQGRAGKGVKAWDLPPITSLVGLAIGKGNQLVTLHLLKAAPKSSRIDAAPIRKRASKRGTEVVDVKLGDLVLGMSSSWEIENILDIKTVSAEEKTKRGEPESSSGSIKTNNSKNSKKPTDKSRNGSPGKKRGRKKSNG
ncbi:MAG TPA: DNA gyrase subunit A [Anaerolineales bacterium]|nr:DNA gyrase subunit A [Anaerolineales bacterium]